MTKYNITATQLGWIEAQQVQLVIYKHLLHHGRPSFRPRGNDCRYEAFLSDKRGTRKCLFSKLPCHTAILPCFYYDLQR